MKLNITFDQQAEAAPQPFRDAVNAAAAFLDNEIKNNITVNLNVGWGEDEGSQLTSDMLGEAAPNGTWMTYGNLVTTLNKAATSTDDKSFLASLPATDPSAATNPMNGGEFYVSNAQLKAWGLVDPNAPGEDGNAGFSNMYTWDYNPADGIPLGNYDLNAVALHELTHALGRYAYGGPNIQNWNTPYDLFTYNGTTNKLDFNNGTDQKYISFDGGQTSLAIVNVSSDPTDLDSPVTDPFHAGIPSGQAIPWTTLDSRIMDALGYNVDAVAAPPPSSHFTVADQTTGQQTVVDGAHYTGPVAGIDWALIDITPDKLNITSHVPNVFIHSGSGDDALDVSAVNGTNVLDGSTGSNFLSGGTGHDTFFVDDRAAPSDIWSTIRNFHSGDDATIWGITGADFQLQVADNQGAVGFTGLTFHATAAGKPEASVTLGGYSSTDLVNGRLAVAYGRTEDLPGLSGSTYLQIHAT